MTGNKNCIGKMHMIRTLKLSGANLIFVPMLNNFITNE